MKQRPIIFRDDMIRAILDGRKTQTRRVVKHKYPKLCGGGYYPTGKVLTDLENQPGAFMEFRHETQDEPGYRGSPASALVPCPYGPPGDRLWVREAWSDVNLQGAPGIAYRADDDIRDLMEEPSFHDEDGAFNYEDDRVKPYHFAVWSEDLLSGAEGRWRTSIHMPRWASRITLEITGVRVERLQDISEEDAIAEGARHFSDLPGKSRCGQDNRWSMQDPYSVDQCLGNARMAFANYFCKINGKPRKGLIDFTPWDANPWVWVIEFRRIKP